MAAFILSLKDALLQYLQDELSDDPGLLNSEVIKMNKLIDNLELFTFDTFMDTREMVIAQQSRSLLELSTPVIIITAVHEYALAKQAIAEGAFDYIIKPVNLDYLELALRTKDWLYGGYN